MKFSKGHIPVNSVGGVMALVLSTLSDGVVYGLGEGKYRPSLKPNPMAFMCNYVYIMYACIFYICMYIYLS